MAEPSDDWCAECGDQWPTGGLCPACKDEVDLQPANVDRAGYHDLMDLLLWWALVLLGVGAVFFWSVSLYVNGVSV